MWKTAIVTNKEAGVNKGTTKADGDDDEAGRPLFKDNKGRAARPELLMTTLGKCLWLKRMLQDVELRHKRIGSEAALVDNDVEGSLRFGEESHAGSRP